MDNLILLILGLFISVLGITNIKGNISTIHSYNRRKVKEEDIPKYGKVVGTGTLIPSSGTQSARAPSGWCPKAGIAEMPPRRLCDRYF